jgi:FkbM family methyltransferase
MQFVMFDIGTGNASRAARWLNNDRRAHAFCFDPLPECYDKACFTAKDKYIKGRLHVFPLAVTASASIEGGTVPLHCANDKSSCSLLPFADHDKIKRWRYPPGRVFFRTTETINVPSIRMDKFIVDRRLSRIMFVRVETQGTGLDVVKSFGQHISKVMEFAIKVHTIDYEIYQGQTTKDSLVDYMNSKGFSVYGTQEWSRGQEEIIWFANRHYVRGGHLLHLDYPSA